MKIKLIACIANKNAIGKNGTLPWHLKEDLKHFKRCTLHSCIIMGRKTFESIGSMPLPNRLNIVVSTTLQGPIQNCLIVPRISSAFRFLKDHNQKECWIIGGGTLYKQTINIADELEITRLFGDVVEPDTFFPEISKKDWTIESCSEIYIDKASSLRYQYIHYVRK